MKKILLGITVFIQLELFAQDTFSILAFDSITREVGAAGASCLDLFPTTFSNDFICELFPDTGAIACQAAYIAPNQAAARMRMRTGDSPTQLISWLNANDVSPTPGGFTSRQYGVVNLNKGYPRAAAFTGTNCADYKGHRVGPNYTIHGNILLGPQVLDSMEARFLREKGDLKCKLMAAMQGAKMVGADTRCTSNGTSSLFAFLKVSLPTDTFGRPSFLVSLKTHANQMIEPIDSLQILFNELHSCALNLVGIEKYKQLIGIKVFPNPNRNSLKLESSSPNEVNIKIRSAEGKIIFQAIFTQNLDVSTKDFNAGIYILEIFVDNKIQYQKLIIE